MQSGIGPAEELRKHALPVVQDLQGRKVGHWRQAVRVAGASESGSRRESRK